MSVVALVLVGLLIGLIFGGVGGGGAILTVPALILIAGQRADDAMTSSLVVVGARGCVVIFLPQRSHRITM